MGAMSSPIDRLLWLLLVASLIPLSSSQVDCTPSSYYSSISSLLDAPLDQDPASMEAAIREVIRPHTVIPCTSTSTDCWDALSVLDVDPADPNSVMLIYKQTPDLISNSGLSTGWNREHVWPKSYGVGYTGPDTSDLFALRAADWSVNSARNNRYYDNCDNPSVCEIPAHSEAPMDTGKMSITGTTGVFMPPASVRGDLARSLFYMATRYDGTESSTEDLTLSNCPCDTQNKMGMLSTLLQWHEADPVDAAEMERNELLCSSYQHNRNPYIDFPDLVSLIFLEDDPTNCPVCPEKVGKMLATWEGEEGLDLDSAPNVGDNGVHASAGPIEGLKERTVWLGYEAKDDPFGEHLITWTGGKAETIAPWLDDAVVAEKKSYDLEGKIFDLTEDKDTPWAVQFCNNLALAGE